MSFDDKQLQACFDRNFAEATGASDEMRQIGALFAVHELFHMLEGPHSAKVHETIWRLLLPTLRPSLRAWYQRSGVRLTSTAMELRDRLSQLAGEQLGFSRSAKEAIFSQRQPVPRL